MVEQSFIQKINKMEVNIKTYHITYNMSRNLNSRNLGIGGVYIEQDLKVMTLQIFIYFSLNFNYF